jgi:signal transduction histidine kinase
MVDGATEIRKAGFGVEVNIAAMRNIGKLRSLTNGEIRTNSKNGAESLSDYEPNARKRLAGMAPFLADTSYGATTPRVDLPRSFSPEEQDGKLTHCFQNDERLALQLTRLVDEARKSAALAERSRIAHDLHDTLAQCLTGIYTQLEAASGIRHRNPDVAEACIDKAKNLSQRGLREVRRLVAALQPDAVRYSDLVENLGELAHESSCDASTRVLFDCRRPVRLVPPDIGCQLLQIAREAVGNALRYAHAKTVAMKMGFTEIKVDLSIEDDGIGFRSDRLVVSKGFGLSTMRQRANRIQARFSLRTSPGAGTLIQISAPCPAWSHS